MGISSYSLEYDVMFYHQTYFYMRPYGGASRVEVPNNGASLLHSYLWEENVSRYDPHIA